MQNEKDFTKTPSFYNTTEVFKKYLGTTSYYLGLQNKMLLLVKMLKPDHILELGFGTGQTAIKAAKQNASAEITAVDLRPDMIPVAKDLAKSEKLNNIEFICADMTDYVKGDLKKIGLIYMLYSFHHIEDPLEKKIQFLKDCYNNMENGAYICVAETFIPEQNSMEANDSTLIKLWETRGEEGYASTFWSNLQSLDSTDITMAEEIASYCRDMEVEAGKLVVLRKDEYLIKKSWLRNHAETQGFTTVLEKDINNIGDAILLFRKGK
jgi:ubiquinone/menaquinone biosynthesis C-methylase UbiE